MNNYQSLKDYVYNYISEKINSGNLAPKEKINEHLISEELEISRTPVREALIQLSTEGYLENLPRRGFRVKLIDENKAIELYKIIGVLDALAGSSAMEFITDKEIEEMNNIVLSMDKAIQNKTPDIYYKLQTKFHNVYIDFSKNEELIKLLNQLRRSFIRQNYLNDGSTDLFNILQKTNEQHKVMVELFCKKDKLELERYIKEVHWNTENAFFDAL